MERETDMESRAIINDILNKEKIGLFHPKKSARLDNIRPIML